MVLNVVQYIMEKAISLLLAIFKKALNLVLLCIK